MTKCCSYLKNSTVSLCLFLFRFFVFLFCFYVFRFVNDALDYLVTCSISRGTRNSTLRAVQSIFTDFSVA